MEKIPLKAREVGEVFTEQENGKTIERTIKEKRTLSNGAVIIRVVSKEVDNA